MALPSLAETWRYLRHLPWSSCCYSAHRLLRSRWCSAAFLLMFCCESGCIGYADRCGTGDGTIPRLLPTLVCSDAHLHDGRSRPRTRKKGGTHGSHPVVRPGLSCWLALVGLVSVVPVASAHTITPQAPKSEPPSGWCGSLPAGIQMISGTIGGWLSIPTTTVAVDPCTLDLLRRKGDPAYSGEQKY